MKRIGTVKHTTDVERLFGIRMNYFRKDGSAGLPKSGLRLHNAIHLTIACKRLPPASARASLRLPAAPEA